MSKIGRLGVISFVTGCFVEAALGGTPHQNLMDSVGSLNGTTADAATRIVELEATLVAPLPTQNMYFGRSVAISGDLIVVGASNADPTCQNCGGAGAAYVYRRQGQQWVLEKKLKASDPISGDGFGNSVAIDGDTIVVGAPGVYVSGNTVGAIYVFQRSGFDWVEVGKRLHPLGTSGRLGAAVAISGDLIVASAPDTYSLGYAFVFGRSINWALEATLVQWDGNNSQFGTAVSVSGNTVVVTGPNGDAPGTDGSGAAYVFRKSLGIWVREAKIIPDLPIAYSQFGQSVSLSGDDLLVGAMQEKALCPPDICNPGAAYLFRRIGSSWNQTNRFDYPNTHDSQHTNQFGVGVALSNDLALVGAQYDDEPNCSSGSCDTGAAYSFLRSGPTWVNLTRLSSPNPNSYAYFGAAVAATDTTFVVGASEDDFAAQQGGAVYVYRVFVDCNGNGTPDELETDCNNNDIPDDCDIASGTSEDCNANAVPDECDLSVGTSPDCNGNEIPDECDTLYAEFQSADLTPIGVQTPRSFPIPSPPLSGGNVTLTLKVRGDFGSPSEALEVRLNGLLVGTAFGAGGSDCPALPDTEQLTVLKDAYNQAARTGHADFQMVGTSSVDPAPPGCTSSVSLKVEYQAITEGDCNGNGNPDSCDVANLITPDCNENGIPDECDLSSGFSEDCNGNKIPDECESSTLYMAVSSIPPSGAIDARQDQSAIVGKQGFDRVRVSFACPPFDTASGQPLTAGSFSIKTTTGDVPQVVAFTPDSQTPFTYELVLSQPIPAGAWTTLSVDPTNQNGAAVGVDTAITLGFLPGDVNGSRTTTPSDILDLVDNLNHVRVPPLNDWQCDIDRSGLCAPSDIVRLIDLLNGIRTSHQWNGISLP